MVYLSGSQIGRLADRAISNRRAGTMRWKISEEGMLYTRNEKRGNKARFYRNEGRFKRGEYCNAIRGGVLLRRWNIADRGDATERRGALETEECCKKRNAAIRRRAMGRGECYTKGGLCKKWGCSGRGETLKEGKRCRKEERCRNGGRYRKRDAAEK